MPTPVTPKSDSSRSWLIATLAFLAASGWGVAWWRGTTSADAMALQTVKETPADLRALEDRLRALEFENTSLKSQTAEREAPVAPAAEEGDGGRGGSRGGGGPDGGRWGGGWGGGMGNFMERMRTDPNFAQLVQNETMRRIEERYAGLVKQLRLNPAQSQQLLSLLASRELARNTANAAAREAGVDPRDREAMAAFMKKTLDPIDASIKSAIGDTAYNQMNQWEQNTPYREQVERFENRLAVNGLDLQPTQRDALVSVLATTQTNVDRPGRGATAEQWQQYFEARQAVVNNQVVRAQSVLSTQQAQALSELLSSQVTNERLRTEVRLQEQAARAARQAAEQPTTTVPATQLPRPGGG